MVIIIGWYDTIISSDLLIVHRRFCPLHLPPQSKNQPTARPTPPELATPLLFSHLPHTSQIWNLTGRRPLVISENSLNSPVRRSALLLGRLTHDTKNADATSARSVRAISFFPAKTRLSSSSRQISPLRSWSVWRRSISLRPHTKILHSTNQCMEHEPRRSAAAEHRSSNTQPFTYTPSS